MALGITDDGYDLQWEPKAITIEKSDVFGDMLIDGIYRGTNYFLQTEFLEFKAGPRAATFPWTVLGLQGVIGRLMSDNSSVITLTSTAGTPAATTPATLTATKAILAPGFNPNAVHSSRLRTMPCRLALLPADVSGTMTNFSTT